MDNARPHIQYFPPNGHTLSHVYYLHAEILLSEIKKKKKFELVLPTRFIILIGSRDNTIIFQNMGYAFLFKNKRKGFDKRYMELTPPHVYRYMPLDFSGN